jgi:hypothetical protein
MECVQFIFTLDETRYFFVLEKAVFLSRMSPRMGACAWVYGRFSTVWGAFPGKQSINPES